jgi:hypothetical protein
MQETKVCDRWPSFPRCWKKWTLPLSALSRTIVPVDIPSLYFKALPLFSCSLATSSSSAAIHGDHNVLRNTLPAEITAMLVLGFSKMTTPSQVRFYVYFKKIKEGLSNHQSVCLSVCMTPLVSFEQLGTISLNLVRC